MTNTNPGVVEKPLPLYGPFETVEELRHVAKTDPERLGRVGWIRNAPTDVLDILISRNDYQTDYQLVCTAEDLTEEQLICIFERAARKKSIPLLRVFTHRGNISEDILRMAWDEVKHVLGRHSTMDFFNHKNFPMDSLLTAIYAKEQPEPEWRGTAKMAETVYEEMPREVKRQKLAKLLPEEYADLKEAPLEWIEPLVIQGFIHENQA